MKIRIESVSSYRYGDQQKQLDFFEEQYGEKLQPYGLKINRKQKLCYISVTSLNSFLK